MLPKQNRLTKQSDFDKVNKKGKVCGGRFLILKTAKNNLESSRFAFIVSQKISKKAVVRNKIKRKLREAVKNNLSEIKSGYDIVFFTKKAIEEKNYLEIKKEIENLIYKADLIQKT